MEILEVCTKILAKNNQKRIALIFDFDQSIIDLIKTIRGRKWSTSEKYWHIPYRENYLEELNQKFKKLKFVTSTEISNSINVNELLNNYNNLLKKEEYSEPTIHTYFNHLKRFLAYLQEHEVVEITQEYSKKYILYLVQEKRYSPSAQNNTINALKLFFAKILHIEIDNFYFPRPRNEKKLPQILSETDIIKILKNINDLRIKCMVFFIYSAGLTPSEVSFLKISDIDSESMQILITNRKKDNERFVILSEKLLKLLRVYYDKYRPEYWLFESTNRKQFSKRTLQKKFKEAVEESNINKRATLTILKNSFAVHLIEKGIDIRFVQQILGHKSSKTTMKYLKVSKKDLKAIKSPLDELDI